MQIIATTLIVLGGLLCFANWMSVLQSILTKTFHSAVPLLGSGLLGSGMLLMSETRSWAWLAVPLDYGTIALIIASPHLIRDPRLFWKVGKQICAPVFIPSWDFHNANHYSTTCRTMWAYRNRH